MDPNGGDPVPVTAGDALDWNPIWSPDGRWLAFFSSRGGVSPFTPNVWLPEGRTLLFVTGGNAFHTVDVVTRESRRVYAVERDVIGPPRLSRDGRRPISPAA